MKKRLNIRYLQKLCRAGLAAAISHTNKTNPKKKLIILKILTKTKAANNLAIIRRKAKHGAEQALSSMN